MKKVFLLLTLLIVNYFGVLGQNDPKLMLPIGHTEVVYSAKYSPDGKKIVTTSEDCTAIIWDAGTGKMLTTLIGHKAFVYSAQFSPDGKKIITASCDHTAKVWDVSTGKILTTTSPSAESINLALFSPDGKKFITTFIQNKLYLHWSISEKPVHVTIFDADNGERLYSLNGHSMINSAKFSPDGKKIITACCDSTVKVWAVDTGRLIYTFEGYASSVYSAEFCPDGKKIVTASADSMVIVWDSNTGKLINNLEGHTDKVSVAQFSPDGKRIITASLDNTAKVWDEDTGKLISTLEGHTENVISVEFCLDGKKIVTASKDHTAKVWDTESGKMLCSLNGHTVDVNSAQFSPDGKKIVTTSKNHTAQVWDASNGKLINTLEGHTNTVLSARFNSNGSQIVMVSKDHTAKVWDVGIGKMLKTLYGHTNWVWLAQFSMDGNKIVTASRDSTAKVWYNNTGKLLFTIEGHTSEVNSVQFSIDGKKIVTASSDGTAKVWDAITGELLYTLDGYIAPVNTFVELAHFSPNGNEILTISRDNVKVWDSGTGKLLSTLEGQSNIVHSAEFSSDGHNIVTTSWDNTVKVWDTGTGKMLFNIEGYNNTIWSAQFSPDGKKIVTISFDEGVQIWDADSGKLLKDIQIKGSCLAINFEKSMFISEKNSVLTFWDMDTGEEKYSFIAIDSTDYLVFDKYYRYDGTPAARDYLYYVCGDEIIDLAQMKDALYVPGLVEKIMNGQEINYPKLADLEICDALPLIEQQEKNDGKYHYTITQRRLPLENVEVYVNDKLIQTIPGTTLKKQNQTYTLELNKKNLSKHYIPGAENNVKVVGVVNQNGSMLKSRGLTNTIEQTEINKPKVLPNLYAVVVGINNYKDSKLQLNFPAIDAQDFGKALEASAKKLLGNDHVFLYQINSHVKGNNGYNTPEKESIRKALEEIGKKAQPEDVLLIFFAGHGVMQSNDEKLFTFLTAETSENNRIGINTKELQSWLSYDGPNKMLVNKTILIFDACNSGQATKELLAMARNDDETQRIRQVEDLKDKSGMFILAASAPNQSAYELPQYGHGLLTYSLLYTLKNNPEVLDETKFLNVQKWFLETEKYLQQLVTSLGYNQNAQPFGTANIRIGEVDEKLKQNIKLGAEKPIVICSNVLNSSIFSDDLKLKELINQQLSAISERGVDTKIIFTRQETPNANSINIIYQTTGEDVICKVSLVKNSEPLLQTEITGKKKDLNSLATKIIEEVVKSAK